jgi:hypothetical protein
LFFFSVASFERWMIAWHVSYRRASLADSSAAALQDA